MKTDFPQDYYDAVVVGSGPNGLAAAITLARKGRSVLLVEAKDSLGGGMRSAELTLPGFIHDVCSTVHPLALASPFFADLDLEGRGVEWVQPEVLLAHPFPDGDTAVVHRSLERTATALGADGDAYRYLMAPLVENYRPLLADVLAPLHFPRRPLVVASFARHALCSAVGISRKYFRTKKARALFAGLSAHAMIPLENVATAASGLVLGMLAHAVGWPMVRGGSRRLAAAMEDICLKQGADIVTSRPVASLADLPRAGMYFFDLTPRQVLAIAGERFPSGYRRRLSRYRYGPGVFKMDWALQGPIPWRNDACRAAGTVHLGGAMEDVSSAVRAVHDGNAVPRRPYTVLVQSTLFDVLRAPAGMHTAWAYCHVPPGSAMDMTELMEEQIDSYAPGFRDLILARSAKSAAEMEVYNPNYVGGDINGGIQDIWQLYARPVLRFPPYTTPAREIYICSSATPPGGGVHGLCGYHAAVCALKR